MTACLVPSIVGEVDPDLPWVRMTVRRREHDVRRLRDLLRPQVQRLRVGADLPAEPELMTAYGASRGVVRDALAMLRVEGLIERRQGLGTHTVSSSFVVRLEEAHGAATPTIDSMLNRRLRPRVISSATVPLPPHAADRLEADVGQPCLLLEYVNLLGDEPIALATNYVLEPEATRVARTPFDSDWYALLAEAGCPLGDSQFVWGAVLSDETNAPLLGLPQGRPLLSVEQVVHDPAGRPFDLAYIVLRADRWRFVSRYWREPGIDTH